MGTKLETRLNNFIMDLIRVAHVVKTQRLKCEEEQRARIEAEQQRLLEERPGPSMDYLDLSTGRHPGSVGGDRRL